MENLDTSTPSELYGALRKSLSLHEYLTFVAEFSSDYIY